LTYFNEKIADESNRAAQSDLLEKGILLPQNYCTIVYLILEPMEQPKMAGLPAMP